MPRQATAAIALSALLVLSGCAGFAPGGDQADGAGEPGTVNFYISDEKNQIEDFRHLNVTVTEVGLHRVDNNSTEANESGWVTVNVSNITVDLTELQGENASQLGGTQAPNGTYNKVFIYVGEINATLDDGSHPTVKLPSQKLHVNKRFTVGSGETVDFVFDVGIFKAGKSGKYILKPVVSQSGPAEEVGLNKKPSAKKGEQKQKGKQGDKGKQGKNQTTTTEPGAVNMYVSDEQNAMDDFRHLNVTITKVGIHQKKSGNESNGSGGGAWIEKDVDNVTVDLTELQGANASQLGVIEAPNGTYNKVFVYVSDINGTLTTGEQVRVKLPSQKLHINKQFTVAPGEEVNFVYDISVFKAGKSGKYILKPVVSQSGAMSEDKIKEKPAAKKGKQKESAEAPTLNVSVAGNVTAGENVTVTVTHNDSAVANATVTANGETAGTTNASGQVVVAVPSDAEELEIEATKGEMEGSLTVDVTSNTSSTGNSTSQTLRTPVLG